MQTTAALIQTIFPDHMVLVWAEGKSENLGWIFTSGSSGTAGNSSHFHSRQKDTIEFWEFFMYSGYLLFVIYVVCKYFLLGCSFSFYLLNSFLKNKSFSVKFINLFLWLMLLISSLKTLCLVLYPKDFFCCIFPQSFMIL